MSEPSDATPETTGQRLERRAGCIAGCLAEPFVMVGLIISGLVVGWLWRRRKRATPKATEGESNG